MENQFRNINYLKQGNARQKSAYKLLKKLKIFEVLKNYNPILVGTIPIDIDIANSDLDIICEVYEPDDFEKIVIQFYKDYDTFHIDRQFVGGMETSFSSFRYDDFCIEIFGQPKPVFEQNGYRHMIIEKRLLNLGGKKLKEEIKKLKLLGMKTEPAFASYFGLKGDPFEEMLELSLLSEEELFKLALAKDQECLECDNTVGI